MILMNILWKRLNLMGNAPCSSQADSIHSSLHVPIYKLFVLIMMIS